MFQNPRLLKATGLTLALSVGLVIAACSDNKTPTGIRPGSAAVSVARGGLTVPIRLGALDKRAVQFTYAAGFVNTLEVMLVDSLGVHQSMIVVRNPNATGQSGGQTSVTFQNVAAGVATITVRTTFKQFIGAAGRLVPVAGSPAAFKLDGGETTVTALQGDLSSPVMVFAGADLVPLGSSPVPISVLSYFSNNDTQTELSDRSTAEAGYGVGAATGSVMPGGTTAITLQVAQPPRLDPAEILDTARHVDAGDPISLKIETALPGDKIVVVRGDAPAATNDFFDMSRVSVYDQYPLTLNGDGTATFIPTHATDGNAYHYYLSRGEMLSFAGGTSTDVRLTKLVVHPGEVDLNSSQIRFTSDDQTTPCLLAAGETDTLKIKLRDAYGNPISGADWGARKLYGYTWKPTVEPSKVAQTGYVALLPGQTIGTVSTPSWNAEAAEWRAVFTQGGISPVGKGDQASFSLTPTSGGKVAALGYLFEPSNTPSSGEKDYTLGVQVNPRDAQGSSRLWASWFSGSSTGSSLIASAAIDTQTPGATLSVVTTTDKIGRTAPVMLKLGLMASSSLSPADDGLQIHVIPGSRGINDADQVRFHIYKKIGNADPNPVTTLMAGGTTGTYLWRP